MDLNEVKSFIETNAQNDEVQSYIGGFITPDRVNGFLETEDGKKLMQPRLDGHFTKGLETFKQKTMPSIIDEEIKKRFPAKSEQEIELEKMRVELENMKTEKSREALRNKALTIANEKKLPVSLVDHFLGNDDETTVQNLSKLEETLNAQVTALVEERLKSGYKPPLDGSNQSVDISKMSMEEYAKYWQDQNK